MSTYLVNSQDLTSVADTIRAKGETQASLSFPNGFKSAINAISTGIDPAILDNNGTRTDFSGLFKDCTSLQKMPIGSNGISLASAVNLSKMFMGCTSLTFDEDDTVIQSNTIQNISSMFSGCTSLVFAYMFSPTLISQPIIINANSCFYGCINLEYMIVPNLHNATDIGSMFYNCKKLRIIDNDLDFSSYSGNNTAVFGYCAKLEEISFVANSVRTNVSFKQSPLLDNESLISIANGLNPSVSSKSITLHATSKTNCDNIVGYSNNGIFELSGSGTQMSLTDFILNVKGWSITQ